jgi:superoxide dismutase, Fe-Mn family
MTYTIAPLFCRPWTLNGIPPKLIENHYEHNYGSAIRRLNAITDEIATLEPGAAPSVFARLKREEAELLNSTLLHELYFASLGGDGRTPTKVLAEALDRDFGSVKRWRAEFIALAEALGGDAGWVLLVYVPREGRLINIGTRDHNESIAGGIPILALDMYEHAYAMEWGANATAYVAAFMRNIEWKAVEARFLNAVELKPPASLIQPEFGDVQAVTPEEVRERLSRGEKLQIVDARPRHYATKANDIMDGAVWRDPEKLDEWIGELSKDDPVVTFCVYGFHIGCQTANALKEAGFDARYMAGGHFAWKALKAPVRAFEAE